MRRSKAETRVVAAVGIDRAGHVLEDRRLSAAPGGRQDVQAHVRVVSVEQRLPGGVDDFQGALVTGDGHCPGRPVAGRMGNGGARQGGVPGAIVEPDRVPAGLLSGAGSPRLVRLPAQRLAGFHDDLRLEEQERGVADPVRGKSDTIPAGPQVRADINGLGVHIERRAAALDSLAVDEEFASYHRPPEPHGPVLAAHVGHGFPDFAFRENELLAAVAREPQLAELDILDFNPIALPASDCELHPIGVRDHPALALWQHQFLPGRAGQRGRGRLDLHALARSPEPQCPLALRTGLPDPHDHVHLLGEHVLDLSSGLTAQVVSPAQGCLRTGQHKRETLALSLHVLRALERGKIGLGVSGRKSPLTRGGGDLDGLRGVVFATGRVGRETSHQRLARNQYADCPD